MGVVMMKDWEEGREKRMRREIESVGIRTVLGNYAEAEREKEEFHFRR